MAAEIPDVTWSRLELQNLDQVLAAKKNVDPYKPFAGLVDERGNVNTEGLGE